MTVAEWIRYSAARLEAAGVESPRLEAEVLAGHVLLVDRTWLHAHADALFPDLAGEGLLQRREKQEPLAYIVGGREFYGRWFHVRPGVLIPRQETEILVELALQELDRLETERNLEDYDAIHVLDIGAGSGAIAITLKLERPEVEVTAIDVSLMALSASRENAENLDANVRFIASDLFSKLEEYQFDLIVSNPPYIGESESLPSEVADFEPAVALFAGPTGLELFERMARDAGPKLTAEGRIMVEVGYRQADRVKSIFESLGWRHVMSRDDLSGVERVLSFSRSNERPVP